MTFSSGSAESSSCRLGAWRWLAIVLAFGALYVFTAQRDVSWQDSGIFQWRVVTGDYAGTLGLALAHPLFIAGGRGLLWLGGPERLPFLLNALAGMGMAVAIGNVAAVGTRLSGRRWAGVLVATMLGLSHTVWWLATIAETYAWSLAGLTTELYLLLLLWRRPRWPLLLGLALVSGLGLCVHNFALLPLPIYIIVAVVLIIRRRLPGWSLPAAAGAYLLGAGLYLTILAHQAVLTGEPWGTMVSALVGHYGAEVANVAGASSHWKENALLSAMNFLNPLWILAILGWARFRRRLGMGLAVMLGAITLIEAAFYLRYPVPDQFTFILPTLAMVALAAAVGLETLARRGRTWRAVAYGACGLALLVQPIAYAAAPAVARRFAGPPPKRQPFRDEWRYWLVPWKHNEISAQQFAEETLRSAEPNAVVLLDSTALYPCLLKQRMTGLRGDVQISPPPETSSEKIPTGQPVLPVQ